MSLDEETISASSIAKINYNINFKIITNFFLIDAEEYQNFKEFVVVFNLEPGMRTFENLLRI